MLHAFANAYLSALWCIVQLDVNCDVLPNGIADKVHIPCCWVDVCVCTATCCQRTHQYQSNTHQLTHKQTANLN